MPPPPHPQSTPDVARSRSHRGAAGRLGGGTNCWCGTAAPRSSPRKAGVQPGLHVWAYDVPRAACASSGALKRWLAADVATFASIYMELRPARLRGGFLRVPPALRPGRSQRWLNAVPAASQRRRQACYASTFLDSKSQFSFLVSQWPGSEGDSSFLCADYRMKREFIITIPDSYFSIQAPASVQWAL